MRYPPIVNLDGQVIVTFVSNEQDEENLLGHVASRLTQTFTSAIVEHMIVSPVPEHVVVLPPYTFDSSFEFSAFSFMILNILVCLKLTRIGNLGISLSSNARIFKLLSTIIC
jgi:hypothetical protein